VGRRVADRRSGGQRDGDGAERGRAETRPSQGALDHGAVARRRHWSPETTSGNVRKYPRGSFTATVHAHAPATPSADPITIVTSPPGVGMLGLTRTLCALRLSSDWRSNSSPSN